MEQLNYTWLHASPFSGDDASNKESALPSQFIPSPFGEPAVGRVLVKASQNAALNICSGKVDVLGV